MNSHSDNNPAATDREREAADVRAQIAAAERGDLQMMTYTSREELYADLGITPDNG